MLNFEYSSKPCKITLNGMAFCIFRKKLDAVNLLK